MIISDADDQQYLEFFDISKINTVNLCLQPDDQLSLNFDPDFDNTADNWLAFVVNSLSFVSHNDMILIFT